MTASISEWFDWAHLTATGPAVKPTLPPAELFKFPPASLPPTLPPPQENANFAQPFTIPIDWYNAVLEPHIPITFALVYVSTITYLNSVNKRRNKKPWAISQTGLFTLFVVLHNIFLSLYSLWTFVGMVNTLRISIANPFEYGLAATADSFCKLNGPRGLGSAATYNESTSTWGLANRAYHLAKDGTPEASDVGRIWNEGLAFYGWLFYLSKFYEVVDTLIIIAKGKKSSFLQTYHHAGAMMCMWAGIRYMSPPIWLFCFLNSFIHFIMYTFYTVTTLGIKVPKPLKRTLTTMQITQFVVGMGFAFLHFFVAYQVPISTPYIYHLGETVKQVASSIKSDASSALSVATATASADAGAWLKKLALRAAGREGLAENVQNDLGQTFGIDAVHAAEDFVVREETRYRDELRWVHCIDTSGQSFAIYLNLFYLLPLTWLFLRFFIKSYLQRVEARRRSSVGQKAFLATQSINDARKNVTRRVSRAFEDYQGANGDANGENYQKDIAKIREELRELTQQAQEKGHDISNAILEKTSQIDSQKVREALRQDAEQAKTATQAGVDKTKQAVGQALPTEDTVDAAKTKAANLLSPVEEAVEDFPSQDFKGKISETVESVQTQASDVVSSIQEAVANLTSPETRDEIAESAAQAKEKAADVVSSASKSVENSVSPETRAKASETAEHVQNDVSDMASAAKEKADEFVKEAQNNVDAVEQEVEVKTEPAESTVDEAVHEAEDKSSEVKTEVSDAAKPVSTGGTDDDATVQEGKSFAAAAAEGVPEEEKGEHVVVAEAEAEPEIKTEDDEGDSDSSSGISRELTEAMSHDISSGEYSYMNSSQGSVFDPDLGTSPSALPKQQWQWHSKRRGKHGSGDGSGGDVSGDGGARAEMSDESQ